MSAFENYSFTVTERFLRYVTIHTQSDPYSTTSPSTERQKDLAKVLVEELREMGLSDAELDEYGYVYATIPSTTDKEVPVLCFCSHMDTSPDCSGEHVKPLIHSNYQGEDLVLPNDPSQIVRITEHADLKNQIGNDIITAGGTTLLGADNKAGLAEIMDAVNYMVSNPNLRHGKIRILFTPDEEIGRGVANVDMVKLGAAYGYTIDGESAGTLENETFSADSAIITIRGISAHPGFAKNKMESAIKIASEIVSNLPKDKLSPESTSGNDGFIHPVAIKGSVEEASIEFILRSFDTAELTNYKNLLLAIGDEVLENYPGSEFSLEVKEQYRNMKEVLQHHPQAIRYAEMAIERAGLQPRLRSIRGGTDGSRLSFMGLPCPNIFAGAHAFHGKQEWVSVQDMQKAVETIVNLAVIWEEKVDSFSLY